jgi:hypothetical protein
MKALTKDQSQAIHFKAKLKERYGFHGMNRREYQLLCKRASMEPIILRQSGRVSVRRVTIRGVEMFCIFDAFRDTLVTVLPRDIISEDQVHEYIARRRS